MKHLNTFSNFNLNENSSGSPKLPESAIAKILDVMNTNVQNSIRMYLAFSKDPSLLDQLQSYQNKINGKDLESIIASQIEKDPSEISLLDKNPELKAKIIKYANVDDFSKVGRLKKLGII